MHVEALAFDLDGTLIDSAAGIAYALNRALEGAGLAEVAPATVRSWIGDGPDALIQRALAASGVSSTAGLAVATQLRAVFDATTLHDRQAQGEAFDGIADLLGALKPNYPIAVVTNKPTALACAVLEAAGLLTQLAAVHGADEPAQRKPSPYLLERAAASLGIAPASLLLVGDGEPDRLCARAAGCGFAWASWGYGQVSGADVFRLDSPRDLLARLPAAQRTTNL